MNEQSRNIHTHKRSLDLLRHNGESILQRKQGISLQPEASKRAKQYKNVLTYKADDVHAWNANKSELG